VFHVEQPHIKLSELEKSNRRKFVAEYLIDYNPTAACMRMGYSRKHAEMYAPEFMSCPFVQKQISDSEFALTVNTEESIEKAKKRLVVSLWREANNTNPKSRVQALSVLKSILYKDEAKKEDNAADLFRELIEKVSDG